MAVKRVAGLDVPLSEVEEAVGPSWNLVVYLCLNDICRWLNNLWPSCINLFRTLGKS